jgi:two-component system phosphate regulon response regulator PhoB
MKKILLIEDHADLRKLLRLTLEFEDCQITEATNGAIGLAAAMQSRPDVVLLDVMMPGALDGLEVCRRIKAAPELRHTRVVMVTARGHAADREAGLRAGADAYLVKPFSPLQVIETLQALAGSTA